MLADLLRKEIRNEREGAQDEQRRGGQCLGARVSEFGVGPNGQNEIDNESQCGKDANRSDGKAYEETEASKCFREPECPNEIWTSAQFPNELDDRLRHREVVGRATKHDKRGDDGEEGCCTTHG